jgi:Type I restriction modification DNA specificity domain
VNADQATTFTTQVPQGYKQTEIGVIPEDWSIDTIGQSMRLINGRAFKPNDWIDQGIPIIRIQNLNDPDAPFNYCEINTLIEDKHRIEPGDLVFAWSGTKGTSFGARIWAGLSGVLNQHIFKIIADERKLTSHYAFLILLKVQEAIEKQAHGFKASFVHVKKSDLIQVYLPVPSIGEQKAIAQALSETDALIGSLEQLIAKKRHIKQGAMQELLCPKEGWLEKKLDDISDVIDPHPSHRAPAEVPNGIPFLGIGDLAENGELIGSKVRMVDEKIFDEHHQRYDLSEGLIGLGRVASIGKVVKLKDIGQKYTISPTLGVIRGTIVKREYLYSGYQSCVAQ